MTTTSQPDWADDPSHWLNVRASRGDSEAAAACTILSQPWAAPRVAPFIGAGPDTGSIFFHRMLDLGWSSGERALLQLAHHLWNSADRAAVDVVYLLTALHEEWLTVALDAMAARHGKPLPVGGAR